MKTPECPPERYKKNRLIQVARFKYRSPSFEKERETIIRRLLGTASEDLRVIWNAILPLSLPLVSVLAKRQGSRFRGRSSDATPSRPLSKTRQQDERLPDWSAYRDSIKSLIINYAGECSAYLSAGPFASVDRGLCRTTSTPLALTLALALALTPTPAVTLPVHPSPILALVLYEHLRTGPQYRGCLSFALYADRSRANRIPR